MMKWMHADLEIEVRKRLLTNDWKTPVWHAQGSIFRVQKAIVFPVPSGFPSIAPINIPAATKYHYWFDILLDPRYVIVLKDINTFDQSENVDTKIIFQ